MATRASTRGRQDRQEQAAGSSGSGTPKRWWQWFLIYPALGISLLTAAPTWYDKIGARLQDVKGNSLAAAQQQNMLWRRNLDCTAAPKAWVNNPSNVKIDATICDSGDIFVRAVTPDNGEHFKWLAVNEILQQEPVGGSSIIPGASAATLRAIAVPAAFSAMMPRAQAVTVLCQKFIDDRHILRRVQTPEGCFDEVIDTYNGAVVKRAPAPCVPQC
jgi:hypothetical protein